MQYINEDDWESEYYRNDADIKEMNNYNKGQADEDLQLYLDWRRRQGLDKE